MCWDIAAPPLRGCVVECDLRRAHFFFFNDTATTEIYTLSLHDALPIWADFERSGGVASHGRAGAGVHRPGVARSEEHTSELQSPCNLVCRLLLEKKSQRHEQPRLRGDGREADVRHRADPAPRAAHAGDA